MISVKISHEIFSKLFCGFYGFGRGGIIHLSLKMRKGLTHILGTERIISEPTGGLSAACPVPNFD
jgi:hypothetical protein